MISCYYASVKLACCFFIIYLFLRVEHWLLGKCQLFFFFLREDKCQLLERRLQVGKVQVLFGLGCPRKFWPKMFRYRLGFFVGTRR